MGNEKEKEKITKGSHPRGRDGGGASFFFGMSSPIRKRERKRESEKNG